MSGRQQTKDPKCLICREVDVDPRISEFCDSCSEYAEGLIRKELGGSLPDVFMRGSIGSSAYFDFKNGMRGNGEQKL